MSPFDECACEHPREDHDLDGCHWSLNEIGELSPVGEGEVFCACPSFSGGGLDETHSYARNAGTCVGGEGE